MAKIVRETGGFDDLGVQPMLGSFVWLIDEEVLRQSSTDLSYLYRVLLPCVEYISFTGANDLCDPCEALKC